MRILYGSHWFLPYSLALVNGLATRNQVRLRTTSRSIRSLDESAWPSLIDSRVDVAVEPDRRSGQTQSLAYYRRVLGDLRRDCEVFQPEIVHFQDTNDPFFLLVLKAFQRRLSCPFVYTVHDPVPHSGDVPRFQWLRRPLIDSVRKKAERLVVLAEFNKREMLSVYPYMPEDRIRVVLHPVMEFYRHWASADARPEPGEILFFGRMKAYKGLGDLIRAWKIIRARNPNATLVVAGKGPDLDRYADVLRSDDKCVLHDRFIPSPEVARLFERADVVALPYRDATQSGVFASALAFDRPCVSSRVGGLPEMIEDGVSGVLVAPNDPEQLADAVGNVIDDRSLRDFLAAGAGERARTVLSGEDLAQQLETVYSELL